VTSVSEICSSTRRISWSFAPPPERALEAVRRLAPRDGGAAARALQRSHQLLLLDGLVQEIGRSELHRLDDGGRAAHHREHHDGQLRVLHAQPAQDLEPVDLGHHDVEQHDVRRRTRLEQGEGAPALAGRVHGEAAQLEQARQVATNALGVVDHEDARDGALGPHRGTSARPVRASWPSAGRPRTNRAPSPGAEPTTIRPTSAWTICGRMAGLRASAPRGRDGQQARALAYRRGGPSV
jgi:hypothetical protein